MFIQNSDIAAMFNKTADLLDIKGANPFRPTELEKAAESRGFEYNEYE